MAFDAFLKIDGISGESTDEKHKEWIEIQSFSHAMSQAASGSISAKGGQTAGRVDMEAFSVVKTIDKASPKLALACCTGDHFKNVVLELCKAGGDKQKYLGYNLEDVIVSSVRFGGSSQGADEAPTEEISFRYGKVKWTYTALDSKSGKPKGNVEAGWDLEKNAKL